jgi:DeoR/GlpR family transcriptional regulator of sugar metabolism
MFDCASKRVLLADHTKFERRALHAMCALEEFDVVIIDDETPPRTIDAIRARGVNLEIAPRLAEPRNG